MRYLLCRITVALVSILALAGCRSGSRDNVPAATPRPPAPVAWLRPDQPVGGDTFSAVRFTGYLPLHQQTVNSTAFSASGTRLASVSADGMVAIWNLANGETLIVQSGSEARRVFYGPDDQTIITVSRDGLARVWAIKMSPPRDLQEQTSFDGTGGRPPTVLAQSADRMLLAFGTEQGRVLLWRLPHGELIAELAAHELNVQGLLFAPDGRTLASIGLDRRVSVWSLPDMQPIFTEVDPMLPPVRIAFSPDSRRLAIAYESEIRVVDVETGARVYSIAIRKRGADSGLAFSPDGVLLASCGPEPVVAIWDAATGTFWGGLPLPNRGCADLLFSPDSTLLLTLPLGGTDIYLWSLDNITANVPPDEKQMRYRSRDNMGLYPGKRFYSMTWSDDGRFIVLLDELGPMYILSAAD